MLQQKFFQKEVEDFAESKKTNKSHHFSQKLKILKDFPDWGADTGYFRLFVIFAQFTVAPQRLYQLKNVYFEVHGELNVTEFIGCITIE